MQDEDFRLPPLDQLQEVKLEDKSSEHKKALESISIRNVKFDFWAKILIFVGLIAYIITQMIFVHGLIDKKSDPSIITTYIKYSLGFNGLIIFILGYWFSSTGTFSKLIHKIISSILEPKLK